VSAGQYFMVTGGEMGDIRFWDLARRTLISLGHEHKVRGRLPFRILLHALER